MITVSSDYTVQTGSTLNLDADDTTFRTGFLLESQTGQPPPNLYVNGAVTVTSDTGPDNAFGIEVSGYSAGPYTGAKIVIGSGGVFKTIGTATDQRVTGYEAGSYGPNFENHGRFEVTSANVAWGLNIYDGDFSFDNSGTVSVTGDRNGIGLVMANGGDFNNSGTLSVTAKGLAASYTTGEAIGAEFDYAAHIHNTGTIQATGGAGQASIGLLLGWGFARPDYDPDLGVVHNSGTIKADIAIYAADETGSDLVYNSGQLQGAVVLGADNDNLQNGGSITGVIDLGWGGDIYYGVKGSESGGIWAGAGNDQLTGGAAGEAFFGETGNDTISAGGGDDWVDGGRGNDVLSGGAGFDTLSYANSHMALVANLAAGTASSAGLDSISGFERVVGSVFGDTITGSAAADTLEGGKGADVLSGGGGADTLIGGRDNDTLTGGAGDDLFVFSTGSGADVVTDFVAGGTEDRLKIYGYSGYQQLVQDGADTIVVLSSTDSIRLKNVSAGALTQGDFIFNSGPIPTDQAPAPPPRLPGGQIEVADKFVVYDGEVFKMSAQSAFFFGGKPYASSLYILGTVMNTAPAGVDSVSGVVPSDGALVQIQSTGSLTVKATEAGVTAYGFDSEVGFSADIQNAGKIIVSAASDAYGGLFWSSPALTNSGQITVNAGANAVGFQWHATANLDNSGAISVSGGTGATALLCTDYGLTLHNRGAITATETSADALGTAVQLAAGSLNDITNSGVISGDYAIHAVGGYDGQSTTILNTGHLNGMVALGAEADIVTNSGVITGAVTLGAGNDVFDGHLGQEYGAVDAGAGNDWLRGGPGSEQFAGGAGDDWFVATGGSDRIDGGDGVDWIDYSAWTIPVTLDLAVTTAQSWGRGTVTISGLEAIRGGAAGDTLSGDAAANQLEGGGGDDLLTGRDGADTLRGGDGADHLIGGNGADSLFGDAGADFLDGGARADRLDGGTGADTLTGGAGTDTFVFIHGSGADVITDFTIGQDHIDFTGPDGFASAQSIVQQGADTLITLGEGDSLLLKNVVAANLTSNELIFLDLTPHTLTGTSGADTLTGGDGPDTIDAGAGNDTLNGGLGDDMLLPGTGSDYVYGGGGIDTVSYANSTTWMSIGIASYADNNIDYDHLDGIENAIGTPYGDTIVGSADPNTMWGGAGDDTLWATGGHDILYGEDGNDTLKALDSGGADMYGGAGSDTLTGNTGVDLMSGGADGDTFVFTSVDASAAGHADRITDFNAAEGDHIDLSAIDANTSLVGDQAFSLVGAFSGHAGELTLTYDSGAALTTVSGDVNGDGVADFQLLLDGQHTTTDGFIL